MLSCTTDYMPVRSLHAACRASDAAPVIPACSPASVDKIGTDLPGSLAFYSTSNRVRQRCPGLSDLTASNDNLRVRHMQQTGDRPAQVP
jgi:hypothetical protein